MNNSLSYYYLKIKRNLPLGLTIGSVVFSMFSISLLHFAGFLTSIPENLRQVVIVVFTQDFLSTFYFYILLSWGISKSMVFMLFGLFYLPGNSIKPPISNSKNKYFETIIQVPIFIYIYIHFYHGSLDGVSKSFVVNYERNKDIFLLLFSFLSLSILLGAAWVMVVLFQGKLVDIESKDTANSSPLRPLIMVLASIVIFSAYISGQLRGDSLWENNPVVIQDGRLSGMYNVVLSNKDSMILIEHLGLYDRHIITTPKTIFYEIVDTTGYSSHFKFPWSPPYPENKIDFDSNTTNHE
jgi:hypothetical protein